MAQNYGSKHLSKLDEAFTTESRTDLIINKGMRLEFNGVNSVTIYNVDTVAENDYVRSGTNRFGSMVELGTGTQTFTLSQDKSWTFSVDRGNRDDSMMATDVAKAIKRQNREVSVPNVDSYRLSTLQTYATTNSQSATAALDNTNVYEKILDQNEAMTEDEVPEEDRVCFLPESTYSLLKRNSEFQKDCDTAYKDLKRGIIGDVDGLQIVKVPSSRLPDNTGFLIVYKNVLVSPTKISMVRTLDDVQGVHGWVAEGRRYYDAFIPSNKGPGVRAHMTA